MSYIFGKLWHLAIIWVIRKAFQCILKGVRFLLSNHTRLSPTSDNESYSYCYTLSGEKLVHCVSPSDWHFSPSRFSETEFLQVILLRHHRIIWNKNMWPFCSFIQENFCPGFWAKGDTSWKVHGKFWIMNLNYWIVCNMEHDILGESVWLEHKLRSINLLKWLNIGGENCKIFNNFKTFFLDRHLIKVKWSLMCEDTKIFLETAVEIFEQ